VEQVILPSDGDFDFNVVIRIILYNHEKKCFVLGRSAITALSNPEQEYEVFIKVKSNARCFSMKIIRQVE
jgi:anthranilate/para-aminobenzoate synthase component I